MMKENPDVMNQVCCCSTRLELHTQMSDMMAGMSDEQFDSMLKMSGMGASSQVGSLDEVGLLHGVGDRTLLP